MTPGTLALVDAEHLGDDERAAGMRAPVLAVVGEVVRLRETLQWYLP